LLIGALAAIVTTTLIDLALHAIHVYPPLDEPIDDFLALIASSYRLVIGVAAGSLTARLAPNRPMQHALVLGGLGAVVALIGVVTTWNMGLGPRWYPISLAILALPEAWLGARLAMTHRAEAAA
jgi:hypothetical protein